MESRINKLTHEEIQKAPTKWLLHCLRYDIDLEVADMIAKELYEIREAGRGEVIQ